MSARIDQPPPEEVRPLASVKRSEKAYLMVANDNASDSAIYREALLQNNYACDVVRSADEVVKAFLVRDYDAILLSLRQPLPAVFATIRTIREKERHYPEPRVPIVVFSAGVSQTESAQANEAGANRLARKPADFAELQTLLNEVLTGEPRMPSEMIPREPLNYYALLASCQQDEAAAQKKIDEFSQLLRNTIRDLRVAMETRNVELVKNTAEVLRQTSIQMMAGRAQRMAVLLGRVNSPGRLQEQGRELIQELKTVEQDLAVWRELKLGQSVASMKSSAAPAKTTILKLSSFLKNRLDVFSRAP